MNKYTKCNKCKWQFAFTELSRPCPSCGSRDVLPGFYESLTHPKQTEWLEIRHEKDKARAIAESKKEKCCWMAEHTRGFHHDPHCKNFVVCF